jgi:hypothetical protein
MPMPNYMKRLLLVGAILTIGGSFLPWKQEGDFIPYTTPGIRIFPVMQDNGGMLILLLSIAAMVRAFWAFTFIYRSTVWNILVAAALVVDAAYQIGTLLVQSMNYGSILGAPSIQIGLIMVAIGAIIILAVAWLCYAGGQRETPVR